MDFERTMSTPRVPRTDSLVEIVWNHKKKGRPFGRPFFCDSWKEFPGDFGNKNHDDHGCEHQTTPDDQNQFKHTSRFIVQN